MNFGISRKKEVVLLLSILAIFVLLHLSAIHAPYHQDEYKWPIIVNPALTEPGGIPHPPVGEFIYTQAGFLVGYDNFRLVPFFFGLLNLLLVFYLSRMIFGSKTALWTAIIFTLSFYSLLASLMVDTDGAIMPFFFLLMAIGYYKLRIANYELRGANWWWLCLLIAGAIGGFLVKVSAILPIIALALDFAVEKGFFKDRKKFAKFVLYIIGASVALAALLFVAKLVFPFFNLENSLKYWEHFANFTSRGWMQTFIQFVKAVLYLSPALVFIPALSDGEILSKLRPFFFFVGVGLFFYLFAFDFSTGALDRYLQFLIVPLCLITATIVAKNLKGVFKAGDFILPAAISVSIFGLQFFNHTVAPLYPKSEWISRALSLKWDFLYPFSGGSGPLGFYVSFAFMGLFWIFAALVLIGFFFNKNLKTQIVLTLLVIGLFYNGVFAEEYLFGKINGSAPTLVKDAAAFIKNDSDIEKVVVYNDNGGYNIMQTGKYLKRLYVDPKFDLADKVQSLNKYTDYYLVIDIPHLDQNSVYQKYLDGCKVIYQELSGYISGTVYNCEGAKDIQL